MGLEEDRLGGLAGKDSIVKASVGGPKRGATQAHAFVQMGHFQRRL